MEWARIAYKIKYQSTRPSVYSIVYSHCTLVTDATLFTINQKDSGLSLITHGALLWLKEHLDVSLLDCDGDGSIVVRLCTTCNN